MKPAVFLLCTLLVIGCLGCGGGAKIESPENPAPLPESGPMPGGSGEVPQPSADGL